MALSDVVIVAIRSRASYHTRSRRPLPPPPPPRVFLRGDSRRPRWRDMGIGAVPRAYVRVQGRRATGRSFLLRF